MSGLITSALEPTLPVRVAWPLRPITGAERVLHKIAIRLWTIRGVWPTDSYLGLTTLAWVVPTVPLSEIEGFVSRQVAAVEEVREIVAITVRRGDASVDIGVHVLVQGDVGVEAGLVGDLGVYDGFAPGTWYTLLTPGHRPIIPMAA